MYSTSKVHPENEVEAANNIDDYVNETKNGNELREPVNHVDIQHKYPISESSSTASIGSQGSHQQAFLTRGDPANQDLHPHGHGHERKNISDLVKFWRRFSAVVLSPIFLRHRNPFFVAVEILAPAFVTFIIFAAFTSGISWKQVFYNKQSSTGKQLNFPELSMETVMAKFRDVHADHTGRVLIFYTPVNDLTTTIMTNTLEQLQLQDYNKILKKDRRSSSGVIGVPTVMELFERSLYHRKDVRSHGGPVGIIFFLSDNPNDVHPQTKLPYNFTYSISLFDRAISETADNYPFVRPARTPDWLSPYITSGFIGLQFALEHSIIRTILEKQKEVMVENIYEKEGHGTRSKNAKYAIEDVDDDLFQFLIETLDPKDSPKNETWERKDPPRQRIIDSVGMLSELPTRRLKMFNYNNHHNQTFRHLITYAITFSLVVAYTFLSFFIVRQITEENMSGIKDLLQMHGLPYYIHWVILFFHAFVLRGITSVMVVVSLKMNYGYGSIVTYCSFSVLFMLIWTHQVSLTFMNFLIACLFRSARMAASISVTSGILSFYLPETFYNMKLVGIYTDYALAVIFPNWCLRHVIRCLIDYESDDKGIDWGNVMNVDYVNNRLSVGGGMLLFVMTGFTYYAIAVYYDMTSEAKLFPPSRKWYDFKEKNKQRKESRAHHIELLREISEGRENEFEKPAIYEEPDPSKKCFVHIRHVSKRYGKHNIALDSINMNIMHEEITVFLGHCGSGKSTLISVLAGMSMPSQGYATVKGYDVHFDAKKARHYTGLCTQKLVAFNLLTVREHVNLCYRLRGYSIKETKKHSATLLTKLKLWNVRSFLPNSLTTEELRRLGISLALADAPKVLLLDEPTGGMDPRSRREVWDIIRSLRNHHTIILTTNFIDEAEFLADRIALLVHGRLVCFGSLNYLRSQYDTGYFLKIDPIPNVLRLDQNSIINVVKSHVGPNVNQRLHQRIKEVDSLVLELPTSEKSHFADLCEELEEKRIHSVAAAGYSMDLYVRRDSTGEIRSTLKSEIPNPPEVETRVTDNRHHLIALLKKRWAVIKSRNQAIFFYLLAPLIVIWIVVFQAKLFVLSANDSPSRMMTSSVFGKNLQLYYRVTRDDFGTNYSGHLESILHGTGQKLEKNEGILNKLYEAIHTDAKKIGYAKEQHMVAFELRRKTAARDFNVDLVGYFASGALHSSPIAMNIMSNVFLSAISGSVDYKGKRYSVNVINDPMPRVANAKFEVGCGVTCVLLGVLMSSSIAFLSHSCILFPMMERENGMKHLQLMCGVHPVIYWVADYIVDVIVMLIMNIVILIIFMGDYYHTFNTAEIVGALFLMCSLYLMWSGQMYAYFMSTIIPTKYSGYNVLAVLHLLFGIIPMMWLSHTIDSVGIFVRNVLLALVPSFTITSAFHNYFVVASKRNICRGVNDYIVQICSVRGRSHSHISHSGHSVSERAMYSSMTKTDPILTRCCDRICLPTNTCFKPPNVFNGTSETWSNPGLITDVVFLFFQGFLYWGLLILSEKKVLSRMAQKVVKRFLEYREMHSPPLTTRRDVRHESLLVKSILDEESFPEDVAILCKDLTKSYAASMIIKDFNLELKTGQCVSILGGGGTGKSTICRMIAGELIPTRGDCFVKNASLLLHRKDYLSCIGYCPQKNCLFPDFTGSQMLELLGRLRGIPANELSTHVQKWLSVFGLTEVANEKTRQLGVGMRHRLGAAMALIGGPKIILLDEPTSGIDPSARERFWAVIEHLNNDGNTIIFTTYGIDEATALSQKILVISDGNVQSIGSPDELQQKYAQGHMITFRLKHDLLSAIEVLSVTTGRVSDFKKVVQQTFKHIDLLDEHDNILMYFLRDMRFTWADVFRRAEYIANMYDVIVESYEVSEANVDDVFIYLSNKFHELDKPRRNDPVQIITFTKEDAELEAIEAAQANLKMGGLDGI